MDKGWYRTENPSYKDSSSLYKYIYYYFNADKELSRIGNETNEYTKGNWDFENEKQRLGNVIDKKSLEKTSIPEWIKFKPEGWYYTHGGLGENTVIYYLNLDGDAEISRIGNENTELDIKDGKLMGSIPEMTAKNFERFYPCKTPSWAKSYNSGTLNGWYKIWTNPNAYQWYLFYVYFKNKEKITRVGLKDYELTEEYYDFKQIIYGWEHNYYEKNDFTACSAPSWSGNSSSSGSENDSDKSDDSGNSENENNKGFLSQGWYRITTTYEGVSTTDYFYFDENGELQRAGNDRQ